MARNEYATRVEKGDSLFILEVPRGCLFSNQVVPLFISGVLTGTVSQREMPEGNFFG
uniref:Uncharacterized protein n=1 Tax=Thermosporothrix sp. COM3 TaxID=2490863 RepID=A0A455SL20_9CHLR|nr:hypothetical protein KTC_27520 [Thermosporothrix sp. COM3]